MKSKYYKIDKIDETTVLVLSLNYHSPTEQLELIEKDLSKKNFRGKVFFDMLLSNGDSKKRYFETTFESNKLIRTNFRQATDFNEHIQKNLSNSIQDIFLSLNKARYYLILLNFL